MGISMFEEEEAMKQTPEAIPAVDTDTYTNTVNDTDTFAKRPVTPGFVILFFALVLLPFVLYYAYQWSKAGTTINTTITTNDDLENGLVLHYTFDGPDIDWTSASAEVRDQSGSGNHGNAIVMNQSYVSAGRIGQGVKFDGTEIAHIDAGSAASLNNIATKTIAFWVKSAAGTMLKKNSWYVDTDGSNRLVFTQQRAAYGIWRTASGIPQNQWVHLAITYDSSLTSNDPTFYINGVATTAVETNTPSGAIVSDSAGDLYVGGEQFAYSMTGSLDDVRIYNRTLSTREIKRLYELGATTHINTTITSPALASGLIAHWTYDGPNMNWGSTTAEVKNAIAGNGDGDMTSSQGPGFRARPGRIGQGLWSTSQSIDFPRTYFSTTSASQQHSFFTWIKTSGTDADIIGQHNGAASGFALGLFGGKPTYYKSTGLLASTTDVVNDNEWHHVGFVKRGSGASQTRLYIDGEPNGPAFTDNTSFYSANAKMGTLPVFGIYGGMFDDTRIYNRDLSQSEIKHLYGLGATTHINTTIETNDSLENGLVGHWTFDGPKMAWGSTTAEVLDSSASSIEGDLVNMDQQSVTAGKMGQGLQFNGTNSYINAGMPSPIDDIPQFSVSAWIKPKSSGSGDCSGYTQIVQKNDLCASLASDGWRFTLAPDNSLEFVVSYIGGSGLELVKQTSANSIAFNTWQHVVVTWTGSTTASQAHIYRDGVELSYSASQNGSTIRDSEDTTLSIGAMYNGESAFDGVIDDVRIYNRVLSPAEVRRLYELGGGQ